MGIIVPVIPIALVAGLFCLIFSIDVAEWSSLILIAILSISFLIKSFVRYKYFVNGGSIKSGEMLLLATVPFSSTIIIIAIVILMFTNISKLHLLCLYPLISALFELIFAKKIIKIQDLMDHNRENV